MTAANRQQMIKDTVPYVVQISPYLIRINAPDSWVVAKMLNILCDGTGGYVEKITSRVYRVSDPVCRELELAGMNE